MKKVEQSKPSSSSSTVAGLNATIEELQHKVEALQSIQDQMEKYRLDLEHENRSLHRQLSATELCWEMTEMKNRKLVSELSEASQEQERLARRCLLSSSSIPAAMELPVIVEEEDCKEEWSLLQIENEILRQNLQRCEKALLRVNNDNSSPQRRLSSVL